MKYVKNQNWFAVFLDFLIVVIGVFIGIQVSNWNEEIAGNRQAKVLLSRLHQDVSHDIKLLDAEIAYQKAVRQYSMTAVDALNGVNDVNNEQFVIGAYQASQVNGIWVNRATYDEMLSTGQFSLIKDENLKSMIFGYYAVDNSNLTFMTRVAPYREYIRGHMPVLIQDAIKAQCGDEVIEVANSFTVALPETCDLDVADEALSQTAELLRSLPDMLYNLQFQIAVNDTKVFNFHNTKRESLKLLQAIGRHQP